MMPMVPEHPVMGAAVGLPAPESEASGMAAPSGELPDLLSPAEVATAMSELPRVASAPEVEIDEEQGSRERVVGEGRELSGAGIGSHGAHAG